MHQPLAEVGRWLRSVVQGYFNYHAVPGNLPSLRSFRLEVRKRWLCVIRRRSQRSRNTWELFERIAEQWLPVPKILSLSPLAFRRYTSAVRAGCANERQSGSVRGALGNRRPYRDRPYCSR